MLKKLTMLFCAAVAATVFTGCSALQTASSPDFNGQKVVESGTPINHIAINTHGLYLLWIPLITGSLDQYGMPTVVTDTVNPVALTKAATLEAKKSGASRVADLVTSGTSMGLLFYYRTASVSGTAVK